MGDSKRDTDKKNRLLDSVGEGEGRMIGENSIETCILPYVKQTASRCMTLRDGTGKEVGGGVQDGRHMYTHG